MHLPHRTPAAPPAAAHRPQPSEQYLSQLLRFERIARRGIELNRAQIAHRPNAQAAVDHFEGAAKAYRHAALELAEHFPGILAIAPAGQQHDTGGATGHTQHGAAQGLQLAGNGLAQLREPGAAAAQAVPA